MRFFATLVFVLLFCTNGRTQSQTSSSDHEPCGVDVRWLNTSGNLNHSRSSETAQQLSLLVHLGRGSDCSTAEVTVTATYLTPSQELICSGTIRAAMNVSSPVQVFNISIRPFMQLDFLRWRNQPGARGEQLGKRLACMNVDGTSDLSDTDRQRAEWMRLSIGVMPAAGGVGLTEAMVHFVP